MSKPYQEIVTALIDRVYRKKVSETTRIILKKYFTQESSRRKLTLEALGKLPELNREVSRERARQIISLFVEKDFPAELRRLERGLAAGDPITLESKADLIELRTLLEKLISEIKTAEKPVLANRIQDLLVKGNVIDDKVFLPIAVQLAKSFGISTDFYFFEFNGCHIIFGNDHDAASATKEIIQYAGKISTHFGGFFSIDMLIDTSWNSSAPPFLGQITSAIKREYVVDLLSTEHDYLSIGGGKFYALTSRDERVSSILKPIFFYYQQPLKTERVIPSIKRALKHIFRRNADDRQNVYLELLEQSDTAIDDFCLATGLLEESSPGFRSSGGKLSPMLKSYEPSDIVKNQLLVLNVIRQNGAPLDSMKLGRELKDKIPIAFKPFIYSYPTLYYKEGGGRRNDFYKPLDDIYDAHSHSSLGKDARTERIAHIKQKIAELMIELDSFDARANLLNKVRLEQTMLREYLMLQCQDSSVEDDSIGICGICRKSLPSTMLIAAHVKPRAKCTHEERADIDNVAMLQCVTCDALFENGLITIQYDGAVVVSRLGTVTQDLNEIYSIVEGSIASYINGNNNRLSYLRYHWANVFRGTVLNSEKVKQSQKTNTLIH
ncbi:HNH endonuclease [Pseudomonas farris]